ncbi:lipopolysaccharide biosynthesis protein [Flavobacterium haoranii]|uniref:Membrane protein involved in the export of O-antigen and teichoic acid n=1 Tax=Flavobacterium haoranii TaxID=683124 RepID=A0A1M6JBA2_9FLAO|nr:polysaccharide biosynthesis C-terminal domain-containing protein [Flavobacterium haoranii]SHJ43934.1 Membrane protein involved in the export of O-antigen and teichoic acid [Flavobacterium haoranii]
MQDSQSHKQAFWFTIINYIGIVIGLLSTLFLYPYDYGFYGEIAYIDSLAQILYPIMVFGGSQALIHFYPSLSLENKKSLFQFTIKTVFKLFIVLTVFLILAVIIFDWDKKTYLYYAMPLAVLMALIEVFKRQAANLQKIAVPTFYEKIIPKIAMVVVFGIFYLGYVSDNVAYAVFIVFYLFLAFFVAKYVSRKFPISFASKEDSFFSDVSKKEYFNYCFYSFLGSFGSFLAFRVDGLMIPEFLDFDANGAYRNAVNFAAAMAIPATGLFTIYSPQISAFIKNKDFETLQMKYTETAKLLFFIGAVILGCVLVGAEPFFNLLATKDKLVTILPVIYILGANVLFNMATGFNSEIISYSQYYKFNIIAVLILVVVNVLLNYVFLTQTELEIVGVSLATFISLVLFNVSKLVFIYKKIGIIPFDRNYALLIIVMGIIIVTGVLLPSFKNLWLETISKVGFVLIASLIVVYFTQSIPSFNYWVNRFLKN